MMLTVNGQVRGYEAADVATVFAREAEETGIESPQGVAIAVNGRVVRRSEWERTPIRDGARVEIVRALQGG